MTLIGIWVMQVTFVLTLLLLEAGGNFSDEGRHVLFTATSALMTFVLMVISDLSDSADGVYAATGAPSQQLGSLLSLGPAQTIAAFADAIVLQVNS